MVGPLPNISVSTELFLDLMVSKDLVGSSNTGP